jgi:hypothetical protein
MGAALRWFGFDEEAVAIGSDYALVLILDFCFLGINGSLHALLDIINLQVYTTTLVAAKETCAFLIILLVSIFATPSLQAIGMIHILVGIAFLLLNVAIIWRKGWFGPYLYGLMGTVVFQVSSWA